MLLWQRTKTRALLKNAPIDLRRKRPRVARAGNSSTARRGPGARTAAAPTATWTRSAPTARQPKRAGGPT
eukprot:11213046-Lingulodinium_polyedra.AAC.1